MAETTNPVAGSGVKVTTAVDGATRRLSVESVAVNVAAPLVSDFTAKLATPLESATAEEGETVSLAPRLEPSATDFPETTFE